jgi:hypothetical protein
MEDKGSQAERSWRFYELFHPNRAAFLDLLFQQNSAVGETTKLSSKQSEEEWVFSTSDPKWELFRSMPTFSGQFRHGDMRVLTVRIALLLMAPEIVGRMCRLYQGIHTAQTIK